MYPRVPVWMWGLHRSMPGPDAEGIRLGMYADNAIELGLMNATVPSCNESLCDLEPVSSRRSLKGGGSSGGITVVSGWSTSHERGYHEYGTTDFFAAYEHLCVPLALGVVLWSQSFVDAIFVPFKQAGVLWRSVRAMT